MLLDEAVLPAIARGAAVLGAGGGGDTAVGLLIALQAIEETAPAPLVDLDDLPEDGLLLPCEGMGAPTVSFEKIDNGGEGERLRGHVEATLGRPVVALMASEIGGSNALVPICLGGSDGPSRRRRRRDGPGLPRAAAGFDARRRHPGEPGGSRASRFDSARARCSRSSASRGAARPRPRRRSSDSSTRSAAS